MTYTGTVRDGVVVLPTNAALPEGAQVEVTVCQTPSADDAILATPPRLPDQQPNLLTNNALNQDIQEEQPVISQPGHPNETDSFTLENRRLFMTLPLAERRRRLADQADKTKEQYELESESTERLAWQAGDIFEY